MKTYRIRYGTQTRYTTEYLRAESAEHARQLAEEKHGKGNIVEIREW